MLRRPHLPILFLCTAPLRLIANVLNGFSVRFEGNEPWFVQYQFPLQLLPIVSFGSVTEIVLANVLNRFSVRFEGYGRWLVLSQFLLLLF